MSLKLRVIAKRLILDHVIPKRIVIDYVIAKRLVLDYVLGRFAEFTALSDAANVSQIFRKILNKRPSDTAGAADEIGPLAIGKNLNEQSSITDVPAKTLTTSRADQTSVSESFSPVYGKVFNESLRATDDFDGTATPEDDQEIQFGKIIVQPTFVAENFDRQVSYSRDFIDSSIATEQLNRSITKSISDAVSAAESIFLSRAKLTGDDFGVVENATINLGKSLSHTGLASENKTFSVSKAFTESPGIAESTALGVTTGRTDAASVTESSIFAIGAVKSDSALIAETTVFDAGKQLSDQPLLAEFKVFSQLKALTDGSSAGDLPVKSIGQVLSDSAVFESNGSLRSQGYCDFDYFAEDYVGQSRTFT